MSGFVQLQTYDSSSQSFETEEEVMLAESMTSSYAQTKSRKKLALFALGATALVGTIAYVSSVSGVTGWISSSSTYVQRPMTRVNLVEALGDETLTCNDGTPAVYYIRKSSNPDEKRWVIA